MKQVVAFENEFGGLYKAEEDAKRAEYRTKLFAALAPTFLRDPNGERIQVFISSNFDLIAETLQGCPKRFPK